MLIVNGVESSRAFVRAKLSGLPLEIDEADDGGSALESLPLRRFDLLITDLYTGPMDGVRLIHAAKVFQPEGRSKTTICPAEIHDIDAAQPNTMRMANRIIAKPIDPDGCGDSGYRAPAMKAQARRL